MGEAFELPEGEARHAFKVLRAKSGDLLEVAAGGRLFLAELGGGNEAVVTEEVGEIRGEGAEVVLYQAVPKGGRMDLLVEKATEVGVGAVVPLLTEHGVVSPREGKVGRWRRVAEAAARQSLRLTVPEVREPVAFADAVREAPGGVLLHNGVGLPALEDVVQPPVARLFIGPEGGWSEGEIRHAAGAGLRLAGLGPFRLRSETAGVVAAARAYAALEAKVEIVMDRGGG